MPYVSFLKYGKNGEIVIFTIGYTETCAHVFPIAQMTNYLFKHYLRTCSWIIFMSGKVFPGISVSLHLNEHFTHMNYSALAGYLLTKFEDKPLMEIIQGKGWTTTAPAPTQDPANVPGTYQAQSQTQRSRSCCKFD